ncbi:hypothetical protein OE749_14270 [Aestuariibacter sp. AA17]|uniref:Uncharacterized protein n=1 Tax=Fluctibacter corallii TaxID=2984329 RepID=A0ABT3ABA0_9ALTE|nr:hypothetical protein [Aestuariibacter sp. AA17]MCV2885860.1 hypothetical protein [Aestuariibacter sp. AA17]
MNPSISRFTHMDDWIFEVKLVRALRVKNYGDPYTAVATLSVNGDHMYIDTQMTREGDDFTRKDFNTFCHFCRDLEVKSMHYDKMKNGERMSRIIDLSKSHVQTTPIVRLVK